MDINEFGLVLAGGGAKGAYQIGALKAMEELGLLDKIKAVSGTSIGGINLSILLGSTIDKGYNAWQSFDGADFIELDENGFDITKYGDGIFTRLSLLKIINDIDDLEKLAASEIPAFVTVCFKNEEGIDKAKYVKLNGMPKEKIEQYLLATSAIPIVYDSVNIDGILYFDGGLVDNTPIAPVYAEGMKNIIVISNNNYYSTEKYNFPGASIVDIVPSSSLDMDTLIGTADLDVNHAHYRLKLGYYDAKAILEACLEGRPVPDLSGNHLLAMREMRMKQLDTNTKDNFNKLENLLGKYGINMND